MSRTGRTNGCFYSFIYIFIKLLQAHPSSSPVVALCCTTEVTEESVLVFNHAKPFKIRQKRSQNRFVRQRGGGLIKPLTDTISVFSLKHTQNEAAACG